MNVAEFVQNGFEYTCFTETNKTSNMAMSVSLFISFLKTKMPYDSKLIIIILCWCL